MSHLSAEIMLCPPERRAEALALGLSELAPSQRSEIAGGLFDATVSHAADAEALYIAVRDRRICGAAWGQRQPGNTATFWPPQLVMGEPRQTALHLAEAVVRHLDGLAINMTQVLLPSQDSELVPVLTSAGFAHLADLLYLTCEAERFPTREPGSGELQFRAYDPVERARLMELVERTYEGTLDCAALNGQRPIDDVIGGYEATGVFRAENWRVVQRGARDVGVLLLADHPQARHWELMYMGLVPEARGNGWGEQIALYAEWLGRRAGVERIVLAVDVENRPAVSMYERSGFVVWDRRSVFVRIFR